MIFMAWLKRLHMLSTVNYMYIHDASYAIAFEIWRACAQT